MPKRLLHGKIVANEYVATGIKRLIIEAKELAELAVPGQFLHLRCREIGADPLLRRPISISDIDRAVGRLTLLYKIVGKGTALLAQLEADEWVDCMGPLGNGFALRGEKPLLVGGGMGLAPLVALAKALCPRPTEILLGGRGKEELFWTEAFASSCQNAHLTTDDGSAGLKGTVVDLLPQLLAAGGYDSVYTCGPRPMMEKIAALAKEYGIDCQVSLEEYMACGVGACLACSCAKTNGGRAKICLDGPVFDAEEVFG
ncbi:dihydroorotate dehydrogenase electron transfer subunit [Azotosporobacter soli]|uniref:dihydroorotate dehydrogenase electron transfer subunit n=1 Tax=Azotosporobacter soli TaxID=3055040 RepID=UPI0031FEA8EB